MALYAAGLGWLLGHRFLLLEHRGRRSGRPYRTVLEVLSWDPATREAVVMSGFGRKSQWYRNVLAAGGAEVRIAKLRFTAGVRAVDPEEAARIFAGYERRNRLAAPVIRRVLSRLSGVPYDGSPEARLRLVDALPLVAFRATGPAQQE